LLNDCVVALDPPGAPLSSLLGTVTGSAIPLDAGTVGSDVPAELAADPAVVTAGSIDDGAVLSVTLAGVDDVDAGPAAEFEPEIIAGSGSATVATACDTASQAMATALAVTAAQVIAMSTR
jgi:hypothetical protein